MIDIRAKAQGDYLLEELPTALKEGDRPVCFCHSIVRFVGLGDNNDHGLGPRVNAHLQGFPQDECEVVRLCGEAPSEQEVWDAGGSWG